MPCRKRSLEQAPWRQKDRQAEENDLEIDEEAWKAFLAKTSTMLLKPKEEQAEENDVQVDEEAWEAFLAKTSTMLLKSKEETLDDQDAALLDDQKAALQHFIVETLKDAENDDEELYPWDDEE